MSAAQRDALAASRMQAADPAENQRNREQQGETIPRGFGVAEQPFRKLNTDPSARKRSHDRLAREPDQPAVWIVEMQPAFGEKKAELRAKERPREADRVDDRDTTILLGLLEPIDRAPADAEKHHQEIQRRACNRHGAIFTG